MEPVAKNARVKPVDQLIGERLRVAREMKGVSMHALASGLSLSYQQIQKYENGKNRISAGTLLQISRFLSVPILYFFEGSLSVAEVEEGHPAQPGADGDAATKLALIQMMIKLMTMI